MYKLIKENVSKEDIPHHILEKTNSYFSSQTSLDENIEKAGNYIIEKYKNQSKQLEDTVKK